MPSQEGDQGPENAKINGKRKITKLVVEWKDAVDIQTGWNA